MAQLKRAHTIVTIDDPQLCGKRFLLPLVDQNNNLNKKIFRQESEKEQQFSETFVWDWPFCEDRVARGFLSSEKFFVCLPFSYGGTGESRGTTKKFEKISDSDFSWTVGLCSTSEGDSTCFWRIEIEIIRNLNMLVLNASRDISRSDEAGRRLKRVRKVYRLPYRYDVSTLTTVSYDWAITIEAYRRVDARTRKLIPMRRADTVT
ncbi:unnamed protein product [Enterobius vermicularis]|uniref:SHSP domain-containing protein n=1 Tax=Enterobius vermicularis TaxID=51028 RepID=A0A0N4VNF5_ENTVE|nr:unnamed protein product [Enterobius vermicularis]